MPLRYEHTQIGYVILGTIFAALVAGILPLFGLVDPSKQEGLWLAVVAMALGATLFSSLTVRIKNDELIWYFGPRFWRNAISLGAIQEVEVVRNSPWQGWGIRKIHGGWLYNVSGLDAVEITTIDGDVIRIGTDEPDSLASALNEATVTA